MNDVLDITWAVTTRYRTRMTNDEARQWFGLGGTTPMWLHSAQSQPAAQSVSVSSGYPDTDHVTAALVTEQQQQPLTTGASNVVCVPNPGELSPVSDFNCEIAYADGSYNVYRVTIPSGWQAGQQRFSDVSLITSN